MVSATVTKERPVHTYAELWHASNCVLQAGLKNPEGCVWQFLSSTVLTAFTFEAYLNHIGPAILPDWPNAERYSVWSKLTCIRRALKVTFPGGKGQRPLSTVARLFSFRNSLAHGKSTTLREQSVRPVPHGADSLHGLLRDDPKTDWETLVQSSAFAELARTDVQAVILRLHQARGETDEVLFNSGVGLYSATINRAP